MRDDGHIGDGNETILKPTSTVKCDAQIRASERRDYWRRGYVQGEMAAALFHRELEMLVEVDRFRLQRE
jgi:hypothetical protein